MGSTPITGTPTIRKEEKVSIASITVDVLNASFEPLSTTHLNRAMALVLDGRAEIIEKDESRTVRALGVTFSFPKVIRLLKYVKVPFHYAEEYFSREGVLRRDGHKCAYCGKGPKEGQKMTWDHILPRSRGGGDTWMNSVSACFPCNGKKSDRTPEEANMPLLFQPTVPMRMYFRSENKRSRHNF